MVGYKNGKRTRATKVQIERAAEIYAENKQNELGMTDKEVMVSAGFSPNTNPYIVKQSKTFQETLDKLLPKEKVVTRISKGMDSPKEAIALGYTKLAAEVQGLTGRGAINIHNAEGGNINLANILGWRAPGEEE